MVLNIATVSVILEEFPSPEDADTMQASVEIFKGMTNVSLVATRLLGRGAIKSSAFESVNRRLQSGEDDASEQAASKSIIISIECTSLRSKVSQKKKNLKNTLQR